MECAAAAHLRHLAHIGKALNLQYVTLSLDAKSILVLRHNSILVLRRHSILRRQGGVREGNVTDLPNLTQVRHELQTKRLQRRGAFRGLAALASVLTGSAALSRCARGFPLCLKDLTIPNSWRALIIEKL